MSGPRWPDRKKRLAGFVSPALSRKAHTVCRGLFLTGEWPRGVFGKRTFSTLPVRGSAKYKPSRQTLASNHSDSDARNLGLMVNSCRTGANEAILGV